MTISQVLAELTAKKYRIKTNDDNEYDVTFFAAYNNQDHTALVTTDKDGKYGIDYLNFYTDV